MFRLQFFLIVLMICSMVVMVLHEERKESMEKVIKASVQKTAFMAFLCHELRNPLHALINVSSLVQETLTLNSDQRELFDAIQASASYMSELINDVLDTSLFESGQMKLADPMPVLRGGINELVEAVVAPFRDGIHGRGIELNCEIKEGLNDLTSTRMLCMDVMKVKQVIVNLLSNAIKFTDKGGKISCTFEIGAIGSGLAGFPHGKQKLSLNRNQMSSAVHGNKIGDGWVLLKFSISDSGIGMTEETLKNLFIPFLPSTMATTREYGGTGLGLVICKKIVDLMEGKIFVKSAQNEGTTFTVEIPVRLASGKEHIWEESEGAKSVRFGIETITPDTEKFLPPPPPLPQIPPEVLIEVRETHPTTSLQRVEQKLRESQSRMSLSRLSSPSPYPEDSFQTDEKFRLSCSLKRPGTMLMHVTSPINDANVVRSGNLDVIKSGVSNTSTLHFGTSHNASGSISPQNLNDSGIGPKNILVVDDSGINRKIIVKFLRTINAKFRIDEAVNGLEAVEKASLSQYDIIFMDLTMPVMGGREATRQIKQELKVPAPVIAVTGDNLPTEELDKLFEIGFTAVQPKPFTKEKIEKYFQCIKNNP
ncbi:hypothetical protein BDR26DRAFT_44874 [Obelidium mucronatum]|nr:hypothetical protein BDR26DRAFT_44874 [Obelidium mucronatum]